VGSGGRPVLFCHGLFGQGKNWTGIAKSLSSQYTSLLVDLPNHGRSAWTDDVGYPEMAARVAELLVARADGPAAVVGHSMGGKVAMALALHHPDLVERLCVVDIAPMRYDSMIGFGGYVRGMQALDLTTLTSRTDADEQLRLWVSDPVVRGFLLQNLRRDSDGWHWQMNLKVLGDHLADLGDWPDLPTSPYDGPVLWMAGARSSYVTTAYAAGMRALFPRTMSVTVKNAGHWVHSEQPEVFTSVLRQFLLARPAADTGQKGSDDV
jgi:pimeloyl-ACP methyl ester carboxylesterase